MSKQSLMPTLLSFLLIKTTIELNEKTKIISLTSLDLEKIRNDILNNHNYHRKQHQVGSLSRSSDLESIAQKYAEKLASDGALSHSNALYNGEWMGENLCAQYYSVNGTEASEMWYNEVKDYNYNKPGFSSDTGHFTQVVWKDTTQIGCGAACNEKNFCPIVCNYFPGGNNGGTNEYAKNVFDIGDGSSSGSGGSSGSGSSTDDSSKNGNSEKSGGMSGVAIFFLVFFIIIVLAVGGFAVYHFVIQKKTVADLKDYLKYFTKKE